MTPWQHRRRLLPAPATSSVYFQPSYGSDAAALAGKLNLASTAVFATPQPPPVANLNDGNAGVRRLIAA